MPRLTRHLLIFPGIYPFDSNAFQGDDFLGSFVTHRPELDETNGEDQQSNQTTSNACIQPELSSVAKPEQVRPFPKAAARKAAKGGRKRATTRILTDTPVKMHLKMNFRHEK
jgi:hypothetical protein